MKIVVDYDLCEANAVCMDVCPECFRVEEDDSLTVLVESPGEELRDKVNEAVRLCPRQAITVEVFEAGDSVKVTGTSKGKGFQGVVKRYGFAGRPASHGHPMSRIPGSIGPGTDPSRVIKGKKLPGRMGGARVSLPNAKVVRVDLERNLLFIKGGVPGSRNSYLLIQK